MYRFSRSIYRELAPRIDDVRLSDGTTSKQRVLASCECAIRRLATDRRYFARPAKSLFDEVRVYFPMAEQQRVRRIVERNITLAIAYLEQLPSGGIGLDGEPISCQASTRKGKPCQREPLPGRRFCPSHKHLEELEELEEIAFAEAEAEGPEPAERASTPIAA